LAPWRANFAAWRQGRSRPASQPDLRRPARRDAAPGATGGELPKLGESGAGRAAPRPARAEIAAEIARQLDAFEDALGRAPDFVDGHQHVHVLPGVRGAVLMRCRALSGGRGLSARPADSLSRIRARGVAVGKALVIASLATGLRAAALEARHPRQSRLFRRLALRSHARFRADLARFLIAAGPAHLVMCHPGFVDDELLISTR
jgi:predicted glycoside hydrolase/deacetylase ChbG (UPF0249 family)